MTKAIFTQFAAYNRWANARLYAAAFALPDAAYRQPVGVFFGSLHGTLNHLLVTDRLWLWRLTGTGEHSDRLDAIIHEDLMDLACARGEEDERLIAIVSRYDESDLDRAFAYRTTLMFAISSCRRKNAALPFCKLFQYGRHWEGQEARS